MTEDMVDDRRSMFAAYLSYLLIMGSVAKFRIDPIQGIQANWPGNDDNSDDIEDVLFLIANRIGAFVTCVFIEAMRPSGKVMSKTMRTRMALGFVESSIPLDYLFATFFNMLPRTLAKDRVLGTEMRKASHDRLSNALRKIYPSIYETMVERYPQHFQDSQDPDFDINLMPQ